MARRRQGPCACAGRARRWPRFATSVAIRSWVDVEPSPPVRRCQKRGCGTLRAGGVVKIGAVAHAVARDGALRAPRGLLRSQNCRSFLSACLGLARRARRCGPRPCHSCDCRNAWLAIRALATTFATSSARDRVPAVTLATWLRRDRAPAATLATPRRRDRATTPILATRARPTVLQPRSSQRRAVATVLGPDCDNALAAAPRTVRAAPTRCSIDAPRTRPAAPASPSRLCPICPTFVREEGEGVCDGA